MNVWMISAGFLIALSGAVHAETVYVTLEKDNAIAVVDPIAGSLLKTASVGQRPRGIAISTDYKYLFVATSDDNTIKVIDSESLLEIGQLPSNNNPETFALTPDGKRLFVSNEDDNTVTVIDIATKQAVHKNFRIGGTKCNFIKFSMAWSLAMAEA
jgi:DNA-binding beta-propeller fold protein YncE